MAPQWLIFAFCCAMAAGTGNHSKKWKSRYLKQMRDDGQTRSEAKERLYQLSLEFVGGQFHENTEPASLSKLPKFTQTDANGWSDERRKNGDVIGVGEQVRVRINVGPTGTAFKSERSHPPLCIALCGDECTSVFIKGVSQEEFLYEVWQTFPMLIWDNLFLPSEAPLRSLTGPSSDFSPGSEHVFVVERQPGKMRLWMDGHPDSAQVVDIREDQDQLRTYTSDVLDHLDFVDSPSVKRNLVSPALTVNLGSRLCVNLEYTTKTRAIELFAMLTTGHNVTLWEDNALKPELQTATVLVPHPAEGTTWRLGVSCPECVQNIEPCSAADANDALSALRPDQIQTVAADHVCFNGGLWLGAEGCACPPGFTGLSCELGCGPGWHGADCSERCGRGELICVAGLDCLCAAGYGGDTCDTPCSAGRYGAGCLQQCGHCASGTTCDTYTGLCMQGCSPGYSGEACMDELAHLVDGPNITTTEDKVIHGSLNVTEANTVGKGKVQYVRIEYKESTSGDWITFTTLQFVQDSELLFRIDSLQQGTHYDVRALLLDSELNAFQPNVTPYTQAQTRGQRPVSDLETSNTQARAAEVTWESKSNATNYLIRYTCVKLLACPSEQCTGPSGGLMAAGLNRSALLTKLQPAATYLVEVIADEAVWDSLLVSTTAAASQALAELTADPVSVTNSSALIRWRPPSSCSQLHGPVRDYPWELVEASAPAVVLRSNRSTRPALSLHGLRPYTNYILRVQVANPLGHDPGIHLPINFTTLPSLPSAPRDLVAYRWSRKSVWLSWLSPELPGGELVRYEVTAEALSHRLAEKATGAECSAWPGRVCHALHGLRPGAEYTVTVRAVNRYSDQPGQPATVTASTTIGSQRHISQPPVDLKCVDGNDTSVTVQWSLPRVIGSEFGQFVVYVQDLGPSSDEEGEKINRIEVSDTNEKPWYRYTVTNLRPNNKYNVAVKLGFKGAMAEVLAETKETAKQMPRQPKYW